MDAVDWQKLQVLTHGRRMLEAEIAEQTERIRTIKRGEAELRDKANEWLTHQSELRAAALREGAEAPPVELPPGFSQVSRRKVCVDAPGMVPRDLMKPDAKAIAAALKAHDVPGARMVVEQTIKVK